MSKRRKRRLESEAILLRQLSERVSDGERTPKQMKRSIKAMSNRILKTFGTLALKPQPPDGYNFEVKKEVAKFMLDASYELDEAVSTKKTPKKLQQEVETALNKLIGFFSITLEQQPQSTHTTAVQAPPSTNGNGHKPHCVGSTAYEKYLSQLLVAMRGCTSMPDPLPMMNALYAD